MKRAKEPSICRVKIYRPGKLPVQKPKTCEVKIYGKENMGGEWRVTKNHLLTVGMNQIAAQVANRLSRHTCCFKNGGGARISLPEWQAIRKISSVFKILLAQKIYELAPRLRREEFNLQLEGFKILFIPGAKDF